MAVLKTRIGLFRKKQDFAPQTTEEFLRILEDEVDRLSGMVEIYTDALDWNSAFTLSLVSLLASTAMASRARCRKPRP